MIEARDTATKTVQQYPLTFRATVMTRGEQVDYSEAAGASWHFQMNVIGI